MFPHIGFFFAFGALSCRPAWLMSSYACFGVGAAHKQKGNETMIQKKADGKTLAHSRLSMAARMLGGAVRASLPVPPKEQPWRKKKLTSKSGFKR